MKKLLLVIIFLAILLIPTNVSALIISEIMYAPIYDESYNEWIEIHNNESSPLNLSNWTLCNKQILPGYVSHAESWAIKNENNLVLEPGKYAIITDGGSGTDVYSNFNVDENSISLHVDGSLLCTGLSNSGDAISLKDNDGNSIIALTYSPDLGAKDNENSLQFENNEWCENIPTPGKQNICPWKTPQNDSPEEQDKNSSEIIQEEPAKILDNASTIEEKSGRSTSDDSTTITEEIKTEGQKKNIEIIPEVINLNAKNINTENYWKRINENIAVYGLTVFCILLAFLFALKFYKKGNGNQ